MMAMAQKYGHFSQDELRKAVETISNSQSPVLSPVSPKYKNRQIAQVIHSIGCPPGIRTPIERVRVASPTIERGGNRLKEPQMVVAGCLLECTRWGR
jgi:hypothetical protein